MKVLVHSSNDPVVSEAPNSGVVRARGGAAGRSIASGRCAISPDRKLRRPRARQRAGVAIGVQTRRFDRRAKGGMGRTASVRQ
jgi:hypothetical protein